LYGNVAHWERGTTKASSSRFKPTATSGKDILDMASDDLIDGICLPFFLPSPFVHGVASQKNIYSNKIQLLSTR